MTKAAKIKAPKSKKTKKPKPLVLNPISSLEGQKQNEQTGEKTIDQRIEELKGALYIVEKEFRAIRRALKRQVDNWIIICIISLLVCGWLSYLLLNITFDNDWTWQYIYYTAIRITIAGVAISLLSFMFKMLRSYIHLFEQIRHKIMLVRSMANLVGAGTSQMQRDTIYFVLTDKLAQLGDIGILSKENEFKQESSSIAGMIEKLSKMKPE